MQKLKTKYDKKLKKYHLLYEQLDKKEENAFRYHYLSEINIKTDLCVILNTQYGSETQPDPKEYTKITEKYLEKENFEYFIRPFTTTQKKGVFGFLGKKESLTHYAVLFIVPKSKLTQSVYEALFCEYDSQIGYYLQVDVATLISDYIKGYMDTTTDETYFNENLFDSRLFKKILSTENILELAQL